MPIENLTDRRVRGLKFADGEITDTRSGAIARADKAGAVSFSYRYRLGGKRRRIVLGRYPGLPLADARIAVARIREQVRTGIDPQQQRRDSRLAPAELTFNRLADLYVERYARRTKASWKVDERLLRVDVRPHWGERPVSSISRQDAVRLLFDVAARAPVGANRLHAILAKVFSWAVDAVLLDENPMLAVRKPTRESKGKSRALNDQEIAVLWRAIAAANAPSAVVAALKMLLLTGQRPSEIMGMTFGELRHLEDAKAAHVEIPATRMKARKPHIVPLSAPARDIVLAQPRLSEFVFAVRATGKMGRNSLSIALGRVIDGLGDEGASIKASPVTPHDLRRSVITGLARLGVSRDDRAAVVAHAYDDAHAIYDRYDRLAERRSALERWAQHVCGLVADKPAGVVTLRVAR